MTSVTDQKTAEEDLLKASRYATTFFERFDKSNLHDAAARFNTDWLLSEPTTLLESPEYFSPLVKGLKSLNEKEPYTFLVPWHPALVRSKPLNCSVLHQITRELVEGIYIFNQLPSLSLDGSYDSTTACSIPSAYQDTLVGNTMLEVDYFVKSLLHGTTFPTKEKRRRILQEWKKIPFNKNRQTYVELGLSMMKEDSELGENVYLEERKPFIRYPPMCIDSDLAQSQLLPCLSTSEDYYQQQNHINRDVFLRYLDHISVRLVFGQKRIRQNGSYFVLEPLFDVTTSVLATLKETNKLYSPLHCYLQKERDFIRRNIRAKPEMEYNIELLGFVSFMMTFLVSLKKQNRIINISDLNPKIQRDSLRTEKELPPTLPSEDSRWSPFTTENTCTTLHGGVEFQMIEHQVDSTCLSAEDLDTIKKALQPKRTISKEKQLVSCELTSGHYYLCTLSHEGYYQKTPKLPRWAHAMVGELHSQIARQPTITESRAQDQLRRLIGSRHASLMKNVNSLLQACIERGLLAAVTSLIRRCTKTRLSKPDEAGLCLLHYAAIHGRGDVVSVLVHNGCSVNQPLSDESLQPTKTLPIHLAAKSGGLDAVCCLHYYGTDLGSTDDVGWAPIHYAAFFNYQIIVDHLISVDKSFVSLATSDTVQSTPLLLAAQNGCLDTFARLIDLGASLREKDASNSTAAHIAIVQHHVNIIQYLIGLHSSEVDNLIWKVFAEILSSGSPTHIEAAGKCLDAVIRSNLPLYEMVLKYDIVKLLAQLTKKEEPLQLVAVQVLANLSSIDEIKSSLPEAVPNIVNLLSSSNDRIQACACIVISDLGLLSECQYSIAAGGTISQLVKLLESEHNDVQVFACACIGILAKDEPSNQKLVIESQGIPVLVKLLQRKLSCIRGCAANALRYVIEGNQTNQLCALAEGVVPPLVYLLRAKEPSVYMAAARAIEALAEGFSKVQSELIHHVSCVNLLKRLLKMRDPSIKVCGGCALWAIAGDLISNKRSIATNIGLALLVDMLTVKNAKLNYICSEALGSLASELGDNQIQIARVGGIKPLLEVLSKTTVEDVQLSVIRTIAALCMKPALIPNAEMQASIVKARGIDTLTGIVSSQQGMTEIVKVEAACALAKLVLSNPEGNQILVKHKSFSYQTVLQFFRSSDPLVQLLAGYCLSVMVFKNPAKAEIIRSQCELNILNFKDFLESENESHRAHSAFQVVVLSSLMSGVRSVDIAVKGIRLLISLLYSDLESTKVQSAEFIASLAHTRDDGFPNTLVMAGVLDGLMSNLAIGSDPVIESCSVAIGYFTFNPVASRLIIGMFRDTPELFYTFHQHLKTVTVSKKFLANLSYEKYLGFPSLSLEIRGGPSIITGRQRRLTHPVMATRRPPLKTSTGLSLHPSTENRGKQSIMFGPDQAAQRPVEDGLGVLSRRQMSLAVGGHLRLYPVRQEHSKPKTFWKVAIDDVVSVNAFSKPEEKQAEHFH